MDPAAILTILVDGYNVIRNTPGMAAAEKLSLEAGREALCAQIVGRYRHTPHRVIVVFDGDGSAESVTALRGMARGRVVFTRRGETADSVIARLAARERRDGTQVVCVSNDLEVRTAVSALGGSAARVDDLTTHLNAPDRQTRKRYQHRAHVRAELEADANDDHAGRGNGRRRRPGRGKPGRG
ncbi:MAG TPA: NYN domain-containing protein [Ktedonobacterales bacterium]|nr:NYN domain-containing protein [Ktedonobacterales bacterium]